MTDLITLLALCAVALALLTVATLWFRHAPDLLWMAALRPGIVVGALIVSAGVIYGAAEFAVRLLKVGPAGLPNLRFVLLLVLVPWPARRLADLLAWLKDGSAKTGLGCGAYIFEATRRLQQQKFIAAVLEEP